MDGEWSDQLFALTPLPWGERRRAGTQVVFFRRFLVFLVFLIFLDLRGNF